MKKLLFIVICIVLLIFIYKQYRHFYQVDNITFTIWKRWGGTCYITPYRYWGVTPPEKDYIKTYNWKDFSFFVCPDSLFFFDYVTNKEDTLEYHLSNYKYRVFSVESDSLEEKEVWKKKFRYYADSLKLPGAYIDIKEMYIIDYQKENVSDN